MLFVLGRSLQIVQLRTDKNFCKILKFKKIVSLNNTIII